LEIVKVMLSGI